MGSLSTYYEIQTNPVIDSLCSKNIMKTPMLMRNV